MLSDRLRLPYPILEPLIEHTRAAQLDRGARRVRRRHGRAIATRSPTPGGPRAAVPRREPVLRSGARAAGGLRRDDASAAKRPGRTSIVDHIGHGFSHLVVGDPILEQLGPAINAGKAVFLYGPAGNGKTVIAEGMGRTLGGDMFVPHAIDVDGQTITVFDPDQPRLARGRERSHVGHRERPARSPLGADPPAGGHGRRRADARHAGSHLQSDREVLRRRRFS